MEGSKEEKSTKEGFDGNIKRLTEQVAETYQRAFFDLLEEKVDEGIFGINIHRQTGRPRANPPRIDKWSAGCQVIADNDDWHEFLDVCQSAREIWGNSFTYTLLESKDIA